jgi:hypothetical protein
VQDRYAGDVGDFVTFGLLRWLVAPSFDAPTHRLGVVWYRVPDETHNGDGKHIRYLDPASTSGAALRALDPDLYDRLALMVATGERSIARVEEARVLPAEVRTFNDLLTFDGMDPSTGPGRAERRADWVARAQAAMTDCTVVFVDPDNGVRRSDHTTASSQRKAIKHAYYDELVPYIERGQSVIAYHHADRSATVREQAMRRMSDAAEELCIEPLAAVRASRGTARLFLVLPVAGHRAHLASRLAALTASPWGDELDVIWWDVKQAMSERPGSRSVRSSPCSVLSGR